MLRNLQVSCCQRTLIALACHVVFLNACSSKLEIKSSPQSAEVVSTQGDLLGKTPLVLDDDQVSKISENGLIQFKVSADGYIPRLVVADEPSTREIFVNLPKSESKTFKSEFSQDFRKDMNQMIREAFLIQQEISKGQKSVEAKVEAFKASYPDIAYGYVISAHLALKDGNKDLARRQLLKAQKLDPEDQSVQQSLRLLAGATSQPNNSKPEEQKR